MSFARPWSTSLETPILEGSARTSALNAVHALAADLLSLPPYPNGLSPHRTSDYVWHLATAALFFAYLSRSEIGERKFEIKAEELLDAGVHLTEEANDVRPSLFGGAAGLGWCIHHVGRLLGTVDPTATQVLDTELLSYLAESDERNLPFDLMGGLVGIGVYALEAQNHQLAEHVVDCLGTRAEETQQGLTWRTAPEQSGQKFFPQGHYNLGLAHGVAGVAAFLATVVEMRLRESRARRLLLGAVGWLQEQELDEDEPRIFPWALAVDQQPPLTWAFDPGWAYADAGIAFALLRSGQVLEDVRLYLRATSIAEKEIEGLSAVPVRNPGIGFGPAGFAQIFARLYQQTGQQLFLDAARRALRDLLALRQPEKGLGGFVTVDRHGRERSSDIGFLGGAIGIGLVLLAACSSVEPLWDRLLLLSGAPRSHTDPSE